MKILLDHATEEWYMWIESHGEQLQPVINLVGGFNPSEKYESQLGWLFPIYGKIKNVPNHQPVNDADQQQIFGWVQSRKPNCRHFHRFGSWTQRESQYLGEFVIPHWSASAPTITMFRSTIHEMVNDIQFYSKSGSKGYYPFTILLVLSTDLTSFISTANTSPWFWWCYGSSRSTESNKVSWPKKTQQEKHIQSGTPQLTIGIASINGVIIPINYRYNPH